MGAYALSRHGWPGRSLLAMGLLSTQMIPSAVLVIPIFVIFRQAGLVDSHLGLITVDTALTVPVGIWILKGAFDTIPEEIADAAFADGCSELGVLVRMMLPLSLPALVAVAVIAFFTAWDEFVFASVFIISQSSTRFLGGHLDLHRRDGDTGRPDLRRRQHLRDRAAHILRHCRALSALWPQRRRRQRVVSVQESFRSRNNPIACLPNAPPPDFGSSFGHVADIGVSSAQSLPLPRRLGLFDKRVERK